MAMLFEERRIPYRLNIYEGANHAILEKRDAVDDEVIGWFDRFCKNDEEVPDVAFHGH